MSKRLIRIAALALLNSWTAIALAGTSIPIDNASFEAPVVDPTGFSAVPFVDGWTEIDVDIETSTNTGVFANPAEGSPERLINADGSQLAFVGSQTGNALEQDLIDTYRPGCDYQLVVAVGVSGTFPPAMTEPADALELVLYYRDSSGVVDVARRSLDATGLSSMELKDFSLYLPPVQATDAWAARTIGVALRAAGIAGGFWDVDNVRLIESAPVSIPIENASFEAPPVDPNAFPAVPFVDNWVEIDVDALGSTNTGVFANTPAESPDHVVNAHGSQLAFLGSQAGNALEQDLIDTYRVGCDYDLTAAVGISGLFPPSAAEPVDTLELVLYYRDGDQVVDVASHTVEATGFSSVELTNFSLRLPTVRPDDAWAGMTIGVALRAAGMPGGFWDIDNVRLIESSPALIQIDNSSFETPIVDPGDFSALPLVDGWTEIDLDAETSTNTGVFANTPTESPDHVVNAHGNQLAFLGSQAGNALEQDLTDTYRPGREYHLIVAAGVSGMFPPSVTEPVDTLEMALYYHNGLEVADVASQTIAATDLSSIELRDFSLHLPPVQFSDAWAGASIGVALRATGGPGGFWDIDDVRLVESVPKSVPMNNASFEAPIVDPNGFSAVPMVDGWTEIDIDTETSTNTGVFANLSPGSPGRLINADGDQLAFLGSQTGNALEQDLAATYKIGCEYHLAAAVGVSVLFPPSMADPVDRLELVLYYYDGTGVVDIAVQDIEASGLSSTELTDFSVHLPRVQPGDPWSGTAIGVALRAAGMPGGFWDVDDIRLVESQVGQGPVLPAVE